MAGSRAYRRNKGGQFASSGGKVTFGKAGGFASASHRANVASSRAAKARNKALVRTGVKAAVIGGVGAAVIAGSSARKSPTGNISAMRSGVRTAANIARGRNS